MIIVFSKLDTINCFSNLEMVFSVYNFIVNLNKHCYTHLPCVLSTYSLDLGLVIQQPTRVLEYWHLNSRPIFCSFIIQTFAFIKCNWVGSKKLKLKNYPLESCNLFSHVKKLFFSFVHATSGMWSTVRSGKYCTLTIWIPTQVYHLNTSLVR